MPYTPWQHVEKRAHDHFKTKPTWVQFEDWFENEFNRPKAECNGFSDMVYAGWENFEAQVEPTWDISKLPADELGEGVPTPKEFKPGCV